MKQLWKKLGIALLVPVAFLTFAEGIARVVVKPEESGWLFDRRRAPDGSIEWQRKPNNLVKDYGTYPQKKPEGVVRIACVGGSTVEGVPFPELAFPVVIQKMMRLLKPGEPIEVIRCGVGGNYSAGELSVFEEILPLDPDIVVLYSAHNEFHPKNVATLMRRHERPVAAAVVESIRASRLATAIRRARGIVETVQPAKTVGEEGIAKRPIDTPVFGVVLDAFRENLETMARICEERNIALVLCTSASNTREFEPMADVFRPDLDQEGRERVRDLVDRALARLDAVEESDEKIRGQEALELVEQAAAVDPTPARIEFARGRALLALGRIAEAKEQFRLARDHDGRLNRAPTAFNEAVREIAERTPALLADVEVAFEAASKHGIVGKDWIIDNVHPTIEGQAFIARIVLEAMARANNLITTADLGRLPPLSKLTGQLSKAEEHERIGFANLLLALEKGQAGDTADLARHHFEKSLEEHESAGPLLGIGLLDALESKWDRAVAAMKKSYALDARTFLLYADPARKSAFVQGLFDSCGARFENGRVIFGPRS